MVKKDPMLLDAFSKPSWTGFVAYSVYNDFAVTAEGFIPLVERTYDLLVCFDKSFLKYVSQSMFVHYCITCLYVRCISIRTCNGDASKEEQTFCDEVFNNFYVLPLPIIKYLNSIGNIEDPRSLKYRLKFPVWPLQLDVDGIPAGSFGQVSFETHWMYESMPSPFVTAMRIQEDLAYTHNPQHDRDWDLPSNLRPESYLSADDEIRSPGLPTKNLLGWSRSVHLTAEQQNLLAGMKITSSNFACTNKQFQYNSHLMQLVSSELSKLNSKWDIDIVYESSSNGSLSQILFTERDLFKNEKDEVLIPYTEAEIRLGSSYNMNVKLCIAALICSFRVKKNPIGKFHSYVCYDWNNYEYVPESWIYTANKVFSFGNCQYWNKPDLFTSFCGKDHYRNMWLKNSLKI